MTKQGGFQSSQQMQTLLAQGGKVATNATKRLGTSLATKASRNLLLYLDHADITLSLTVIKGQEMLLDQIDRDGSQSWSILDRGLHMGMQ